MSEIGGNIDVGEGNLESWLDEERQRFNREGSYKEGPTR